MVLARSHPWNRPEDSSGFQRQGEAAAVVRASSRTFSSLLALARPGQVSPLRPLQAAMEQSTMCHSLLDVS